MPEVRSQHQIRVRFDNWIKIHRKFSRPKAQVRSGRDNGGRRGGVKKQTRFEKILDEQVISYYYYNIPKLSNILYFQKNLTHSKGNFTLWT
jgi:hypothetical protein